MDLGEVQLCFPLNCLQKKGILSLDIFSYFEVSDMNFLLHSIKDNNDDSPKLIYFVFKEIVY